MTISDLIRKKPDIRPKHFTYNWSYIAFFEHQFSESKKIIMIFTRRADEQN